MCNLFDVKGTILPCFIWYIFRKERCHAKLLEGHFCRTEYTQPLIGCLSIDILPWRLELPNDLASGLHHPIRCQVYSAQQKVPSRNFTLHLSLLMFCTCYWNNYRFRLKHLQSKSASIRRSCTSHFWGWRSKRRQMSLSDQLDRLAGQTSWMDQFSVFEALDSSLIQRLTFQFVHCGSFRVPRRPCLSQSFLLWEPQKSKMAARWPQNGQRGLERCLSLGFWVFLSKFR